MPLLESEQVNKLIQNIDNSNKALRQNLKSTISESGRLNAVAICRRLV